MREKRLYVIVTFHTTAEAMATEKTCMKRGVEGRLITVPRALTADCGIAWQGLPETRAVLESTLNDAGIEYEGIHELEM